MTLSHHNIDDQALRAASEEELIKLTHVQSFDKDRLSQHLKGDDYQQVLHGHLYFDHVLTALLTEEFKNPKAVDLIRTSFAQKLSLVDALGLIPHNLVPAVTALNRLRNRLAHNLDATIGEPEIEKLRNALPPWLRKEVLRSDQSAGPLKVTLVHLLFVTEKSRQMNAHRRLKMRKWRLDSDAFLKSIDRRSPT